MFNNHIPLPKVDEFTAYYQNPEQAEYIKKITQEYHHLLDEYTKIKTKMDAILPKVDISYNSHNSYGPEHVISVRLSEIQLYYGNYDLFAKDIAYEIIHKFRRYKENM